MAKNPRPGYATEKQVDWLIRLLTEVNRTVTPENREMFLGWTQEQIRHAISRAQSQRDQKQGPKHPFWEYKAKAKQFNGTSRKKAQSAVTFVPSD